MPLPHSARASEYPRSVAAGREAGLSQFFTGVYGWLSAGVALTGVTALVMLSMPSVLIAMVRNPIFMFGAFFVQMGLVTTFSARASSISTFAAANMFFAYAGLMGVWLAPLAFVYTGASVVQAMFVSAAAFGGLGLYGATTQRNLMGIGHFLMVGLFGALALLVLNMFLHSSALELALNIGMLGLFLGMIAWDHQRLKMLYVQSGTAGNASLLGAFMLYGTFINLTLTLLRLFGARRED